MIRKTIFWIHLACGVVAGLVILMMSVTGVILTYERQMLAWADSRAHGDVVATGEPQSIDSLAAALSVQEPGFEPTSFTRTRDPHAAVSFGAGRSGSRYVDPYTGESLGSGATGAHAFFGAVTGWHRWFNVDGEERAPWRAVTGASNLAFLFLLVSGIYLWLPKTFKWVVLKTHLWFNPRAVTAKARDYNWHHVFGIWSTVPLIVIVATASVFYYSWANTLVYAVFGEEPPGRGGPGPAASGARTSVAAAAGATAPTGPAVREEASGALLGHEPVATELDVALSLDALFAVAADYRADWRSITLQLPEDGDDRVRFTIDEGSGGQPQHRHTLVLDRASGAVASWEPFSSQTAGRRARSWVRFLHTGEALGIVGQTIAGIVSLTSVLMVWTGLALAYRRLIVPLYRRRRRSS